MNDYPNLTKYVIQEISSTMLKIDEKQINEYITQLLKAEKIFFIGIGRVKISLEAAIKRLSHLGLNCIMVGDLAEPPITKRDLLVVASGSGESIIPLEITKKAYSIGTNIFHITSNTNSNIGALAKYHLVIGAPNKSNLNNNNSIQPMSTLFEQSLYLLHDIVSLIIIDRRQLTFEEISDKHANLE